MDMWEKVPLLAELHANLTYYRLNSNAHNPTYQYVKKMYDELQYNISSSRIKTNYTNNDGFNIIDLSPTLEYGEMACHAPGKQAYVDSNLSCFLFQLPFFLEQFHFGYICMIVVIPILLISLFGGIKENYRWFLLNQAIWDLITCYDFICEKPSLTGWYSQTFWRSNNTCIHHIKYDGFYGIFSGIGDGIRESIRYASVVPVFLLAFSRFLCIYFPLFYQRIFSKTYITVSFIAVFNFLFIAIITFRRIMLNVTIKLLPGAYLCRTTYCAGFNTQPECLENSDEYFHCYYQAIHPYDYWFSVTKSYPKFIPPIMFFLCNIFAILLFIRICWQMKFQLKHNRKSFMITVKIAAVIAFQCWIMSIIFVATFVQNYLQYDAYYPELSLSNFYIYKQIPPWLFFLQYVSTIASFNIVRVFLDSLIVLTVISGYPSQLLKAFKFVFLCFSKPRLTMKKIRNSLRKREKKLFSIFSKRSRTETIFLS